MERRSKQVFAPIPMSAHDARQFVTEACQEWGVVDGVAHTVELLTSELVTNGILHARTELAVDLKYDNSDLRVSVHDHDPRDPVPRDTRDDLLADIDVVLERETSLHLDERHALMEVGPAGSISAGRGLLLVEALADEWGVERYADGKAVWFRLDVGGFPTA